MVQGSTYHAVCLDVGDVVEVEVVVAVHVKLGKCARLDISSVRRRIRGVCFQRLAP